MTDRNNQGQEEQKNQAVQQNNEGSKEQTSQKQSPEDRLTDGTNDFKNGDQEPTSERSSDTESKPE